MRKIVLSLVPIFAVAVLVADKLQPLNVRVGLWETTGTTTTHGGMPVPPDMLAKLTPEQRARIEARMKVDAAGKTTTRTYKTCLTQKQIDDGRLYENRDLNCRQTIYTATSSKLNTHLDCNMGSGVIRGTGDAQFEAANPATVTGTLHIVMNVNGHPVDSETSMSSKWLGPACGDVE